MEIEVRLAVERSIGDGIWVLNETPDIARQFGSASARLPGKTILGIGKTAKITELGGISAPLSEIHVLNAGNGGEVIAVELGDNQKNQSSKERPVQTDDITHGIPCGKVVSDKKDFVSACKAEGFSEQALSVVSVFLQGVSAFADVFFIEGKARKWVSAPDNFLALTIQNRNKRLAVVCRTTDELDGLSTIEVKPDRPGYSRFILERPDQIDDALRASRASWRKGKR